MCAPHSAKKRDRSGKFEAATEAIAELAGVARQALAARLMTGALHDVLDIAEHDVEPLKLQELHAEAPVAGQRSSVAAHYASVPRRCRKLRKLDPF